jgi:hypothetical protein
VPQICVTAANLNAARMYNAAPDGENGEKDEGEPTATFTNVMEMFSGSYDKLYEPNVKTPAAVKSKQKYATKSSWQLNSSKTRRNALVDNALAGLPAIKRGN